LAIHDKCVGLHHHLARLQKGKITWFRFVANTHLFLLENNITDLAIPSWKRRGELGIEVPCSGTISCTLPDLKINEEFACDSLSMGQAFLAVKLIERYKSGSSDSAVQRN
jgi:hypothetical protein